MRLPYRIKELTWGQDKALTRLVVKLSAKAGESEITLKDLPKLLVRHDLLAEFFGIILTPQYWNPGFYLTRVKAFFKWLAGRQSLRAVNVDHITNSEIEELFEDFFLRNKTFLTKLGNFGNALGLIAKTLMEEKKESVPAMKVSAVKKTAKPN